MAWDGEGQVGLRGALMQFGTGTVGSRVGAISAAGVEFIAIVTGEEQTDASVMVRMLEDWGGLRTALGKLPCEGPLEQEADRKNCAKKDLNPRH